MNRIQRNFTDLISDARKAQLAAKQSMADYNDGEEFTIRLSNLMHAFLFDDTRDPLYDPTDALRIIEAMTPRGASVEEIAMHTSASICHLALARSVRFLCAELERMSARTLPPFMSLAK